MQKFKGRDERKRTLDTRIYLVFRIATKAPPYVHVVEALMKSTASRQSSLFCEHNHGHLETDLH